VIFQPFQRLGDTQQGVGVGLGLAVARGFVETIDGVLDIEDTPGGGCTMVIRLPAPESTTDEPPIGKDIPGDLQPRAVT